MLFVDHDQAKIAIGDGLLEDGMGADDDRYRAILQAHQDRFARAALVPAGQQRDLDPGGRQHPPQCLEMLAREDFRRRQQGGLRPRLHRDQHRLQRNHRLAGTDVALQQPQHRGRLRQVALDFGDRALLRAGQGERQFELSTQRTVALQWLPAPLAVVRLDQRQREAVGEQFVVRQPVARRRMLGLVRQRERIGPRGPFRTLEMGWLDPFGKLGQARQRLRGEAGDLGLREPFGQRVDRFVERPEQTRAVLRDVIGMHDLKHLAVLIEPPRDPPLRAHRQLLSGGVTCLAEIGQ